MRFGRFLLKPKHLSVQERADKSGSRHAVERRIGKELRQLRTRRTEQACERDFGEPIGLGCADAGRRRRQLLFGLKQIRPPLQQVRGQAGRYGRRHHLIGEQPAPGHRKGFATHQDTELIFRLDHMPFKFRHAGGSVGSLRFKLIRIET